jgi:hypothetical protein
MSARTLFTLVLLVCGTSVASPASAVMYRCDGNLVTNNPSSGKNCVAMNSRPGASRFSAGEAAAFDQMEPTGAGRSAGQHQSATPQGRVPGSTGIVPGASGKP